MEQRAARKLATSALPAADHATITACLTVLHELADADAAALDQADEEGGSIPLPAPNKDVHEPSSSLSRRIFGAGVKLDTPIPISLDDLLRRAEANRVRHRRTAATANASAPTKRREPRTTPSHGSGHSAASAQSAAAAAPRARPTSTTTAAAAAGPPSGQHGDGWLLAACLEAFNPDVNLAQQIAASVLTELRSTKSDDEMQFQLINLLGVERFDLIAEILQHRREIAAAPLTGQVRSGASVAGNASAPRAQPSIVSSITVQTAAEKKELKELRKQEKRLAKVAAKQRNAVDESAMSDEDRLAALLGYRPEDALEVRRAALDRAAQQPIFTAAAQAPRAEKYPFVFDSKQDIQVASAYIQGSKLMLPANTIREQDGRREEVTIPPPERRPPMTSERRIRVDELNPIGRLAFQGFEALNRIQSIVYETAYKTNENLLVCAPTGAGKTNIAMLSILRAVEQHVEQGVIQKDKFKMVYVAPMKALAAEMTASFAKRLAPLNLSVKELTGDMQLSKAEIMATNMLVVTPEKWDVVTRKSTGDAALSQLVRLLIIDEVHLLHDERGPVIESLVARTLRLVESSQSMIRIVGLSATLPNYVDVAAFLRVNPYKGLFHFDGGFRPVPLQTTFIGVKAKNRFKAANDMDECCFEKVLENVERGEQVMIFVHARNATFTTASKMVELAQGQGVSSVFDCSDAGVEYESAKKAIMNSRNKQLKELFSKGFAIHHAGMMRSDRNLVEKYFAKKLIKVLCCTATLAWGVNLPAHAVVIKGTQLYDAQQGNFVDLGILDVQQIFGRAGRPQFDSYGEAYLITSHDKLSHYLSRIMNQKPIESNFKTRINDNLNAEVALGTVTTVEEAIEWLSYSYLFVRMRRNPMAYGITPTQRQDPTLRQVREEIIIASARCLDDARMIRFQEAAGFLNSTDMGRIASHFYIRVESIETFNELNKNVMTEADILAMVSRSQEFEQIKSRDEEMDELKLLLDDACVLHPVKGGIENTYGKVNILLQAYISQAPIYSFSLISDMNYVAQNAGRILRALFEMAVRQNRGTMASTLLRLCKCVDRRQWYGLNSPLRQLDHYLKPEVLYKIESRNLTVDDLREMDKSEIADYLRSPAIAERVQRAAWMIPSIDLEVNLRPITRTVVQVTLTITPAFEWNMKYHGGSQHFWIMVEDPATEHLYHSELFALHADKCRSRNPEDRVQSLSFTIPIFEPLPPQYYVRAISDHWLGSETVEPVTFKHLILPELHPPHTDLLDLQPLSKAAFNDPRIEDLYRFTHFNPVQTQVFHTVYHTDHNVLLGAPTGSGKTVVAELALYRLFREHPGKKAVYIAPLKALVRERMDDWQIRLQQKLGRRVVELTGDVTPDARAIERADVIVTTPEKWDGISRSWQNRDYVRKVTLVIIDEIHLLGGDRGPVIEVIVSRTNYISAHTSHKVRIVGLSTALANAHDLANWLGITRAGLFNFKPSVRPVPLTKHIQGYPGKHYCPRMATMNKPTYAAIRTHSPEKPVLVF
ncbi:uncharacterized protein MONBRDRAFT_26326, partial [Monosiga brevicollis MX1]